MAEWINKNKIQLYAACKRFTSALRTHKDSNAEIEKHIPCKWKPKESRDGCIISGKTDFKSKIVTRQKSHYIIIKGSSHQEDLTIINIYAPNIKAPKHIK